jgi:hypothetical protein
MYQYKFRYSYNNSYPLIEIPKGIESESFMSDFLGAIAILNPELISKGSGASPNDDIVYHFKCILGEFYLSVDIWQLTFVSSSNEELLLMIDSRLLQDSNFNKMD